MRQSPTAVATRALAAPVRPGARAWPLSAGLLLTLASAAAQAQGPADRGRHMFSVEPTLVLAQPCADTSCTYRWTLTSRLGQALDMAEDLFGPRDRSATLLGIDFTTDPQPSHWYPGGAGPGKNIIVLLTAGAAADEDRALYQLAHESFHLLSTNLFGTATNLEEGLATWYSLWYMARIGRPLPADYIDLPKYRHAYDNVQALARLYPDMPASIKRYRAQSPPRAASAMSYEEFRAIFPDAPTQLAEDLTARFP